RVEQLWEWHPTWLGGRAVHLPAWWLHPLPIVPQQGRQILPKSVGEKQRGTVGSQDLGNMVDKALRHGERVLPDVDRQQQFTLGVGPPVAQGQLWKASHNCSYRRSIVMEGNYNLSRYHMAFCFNFFP